MPHVVVKMYTGRSLSEKRALAERLTDAVTGVLGYGPDAVSVAVEDVSPAAWMTQIYGPEIAGREHQLVKRPGYGPLA
jgi:4-oxalocrotonate tautomerase